MENNSENAAALLIKHGANVNLADGNGYTSASWFEPLVLQGLLHTCSIMRLASSGLLMVINMQWEGKEEYKRVKLCTLLLDARATTDVACYCHGRGPLINAVGRSCALEGGRAVGCYVMLCRLLIQHGADKEQTDQYV